MIIVQFIFDLPKNKMQEFLRYIPTLKKTWESLGCKSYTAYRSIDKQIRKDQIIERNRIVEEIEFKSLEDINKFFTNAKANPKFKTIADSYERIFHASNIQSKILEKVID